MEQLAIIKNVGFGNKDVGHPVLFFNSMVAESTGALQIIDGKEALDFIESYGVYDVKDLEGKPVWIERNGNIIKITRAWKETNNG